MLEIIAITVEDARRIEAGGADRIELAGALSEGRLTPSYDTIEAVVKSVSIPVNVIIGPHAKFFHYTPEELAVMKREITVAKELGANGVVFGVLDAAGRQIEKDALADLLTVCEGLDVTFHRAIDEIDPVEGMKVLAGYPQITNVLTSGGKGAPDQNAAVLRDMIACGGHIKVMVGGGLTLENIGRVMTAVRATQYHLGTSVREGKSLLGEIHTAQLDEMVRRVNGVISRKEELTNGVNL